MVTNAHVVWPFETVRVTFPDGSEHLDVPVIGWDLMADLAIGDGGRAILIHGESAAGDRTFALYAFAVDRILESLIVLSPRNELCSEMLCRLQV